MFELKFCFNPEESEIPELPVQLDLLDKLKYRVQLARKIETAHHKVKKANHERNWMKETAAAMELELDSDYLRYVMLFICHESVSDLMEAMKTEINHPARSAKRRTPRMRR